MTIGVYGANGFLGKHLVRRLRRMGTRIVAVSRKFDKSFAEAVGENLETHQVDLQDELSALATLQDVEVVVQLINSSSPGLRNVHTVSDIHQNVIPHIKFIESCITAGVKKYIFISSGGTVYGEPQYMPIDENHPTVPISSYGMTKLVVEKYLQMFAANADLNYVILRLANAFGPGQVLHKGHGLVPTVLQRAMSKEPVPILGDGLARRDYIYVDDVVDAIVAAIDSPGANRQVLNIGSGVARSVREVIAAIQSATGLLIQTDHKPARPTDVKVNVLNSAKAEAILPWQMETSFADGISLTAASFFRSFGKAGQF